MAYVDEKGEFHYCIFDLEKQERLKIRAQRQGIKKLLNLIEDLKAGFNQWRWRWRYRRFMRWLRKNPPPDIERGLKGDR